MAHTKDTFRDGAGTRTGTLGRARSWRSLLDKNIIASPRGHPLGKGHVQST